MLGEYVSWNDVVKFDCGCGASRGNAHRSYCRYAERLSPGCSIQLLRIKHGDSAYSEGTTVELGDRAATVVASSVDGEGVDVDIRLSVPADSPAIPDAAAGWLLRSGSAEVPAGAALSTGGPSCAGTTVAPGDETTCRLRFSVVPRADRPTVVVYRAAGTDTTWQTSLDAAG